MAAPVPLDGVAVDLRRRPPPPGRTSPGCSPPGRSSGWTPLDLSPPPRRPQRRRAGRPRRRSRRSSRPAPATACGPARSSPPSAWPRCRSPAPSRCRWTACGPTTSTSGCSRPRATPRRARRTRPHARRLVKLGRPIPGLQIRIVDPTTGTASARARGGRARDPGHLGDDRLLQPARRRPPRRSGEGWLRTGDLAYLVDGELVMCGRIKDMIIVGGRNVYPAGHRDRGRRRSRACGPATSSPSASTGRHGREAIVVVAESKAADPEPVRRLGGRDRARGGRRARPARWCSWRPGSLPKTSSGKLQRSLCRARYLDEALQPV